MCANNLYLDRLQKLVNKSLRICLRESRDANVVGMHLNAKVLPLKIRRNIALLKLMFSRIISDRNSVSMANPGIRTRGSVIAKLDIPFPKSETFRKSFTYQGPARWLALPIKLKTYESMEEFSKSLREWYVKEFVQCGTV